MGDVNQNIKVRIDAVLNGLPAFQAFGKVLQEIKSHGNTKIQITDAAGVQNTEKLANSIDKLATAVDRIDDNKVGKLSSGFHSFLNVLTALAHLPGAFEGLKVIKNLVSETPALVGRLAGAGTAIKGFFALARDKIGGAVDTVKGKVSSVAESLPDLAKGLGGASAGLLGIGAAGLVATAALGAILAAILAIVAALVAIPAVLGFLWGLANSAAEAGSKFHDLNQQTGVSVELLSALAPVAEDSNGSIEDLARGIGKFNKLIGEANSGSKEAIATLKEFGLTPKQALADSDAALEKVFQRIIALPPGIQQAIAAQKAFGKSGAELIPTIIATGGNLEAVKKKAQELGIYWTGAGADAADEFGDRLNELRRIVEGLGQSIGRGLIPELLRLIRILNSESSGLGTPFSAALAVIEWHLRKTTGAIIALIATYRTLRGMAGTTAATIDEPNAGVELKGSFGDTSYWANERYMQDIANSPSSTAAPGTKPLDFPGGGGGGGKSKREKSLSDDSESLFGIRRAAIESAFVLYKDALDRQERELQDSYDRRVISIAEFYAQELELQTSTIDKEIEKVGALRLARQEELANQVAKLEADKSITSEAERQRRIEIENNKTRQEMIGFDQQLIILHRQRGDAATEAARKEKADTDALNGSLQKQIDLRDRMRGLGPLIDARQQIGEIDALITQFQLAADAATQAGDAAAAAEADGWLKWLNSLKKIIHDLARINVEIQRIEQQDAELLDQIQLIEAKGQRNVLTRFIAERQIQTLIKQRIKLLEELIKKEEEANRVASSPETLQKINRQKIEIENLKNQYRTLKQTIKDTLIDSTARGLENLFMAMGDVITGTKTLGEAFKEMALSIIQELQKIIAQMLAMLIIKKLLGKWLGGDSEEGVWGGLGGGDVFDDGPPGSATGDFFAAKRGGRVIRVAEGGHDEVVLTTDPKHRSRTRNLLAAFLERTKLFEGFDVGGWISNVPSFDAGGFLSEMQMPQFAGAGGPQIGKMELHQHFPNVRDYRDFKLNKAASERDAARAVRSGLGRFGGR
jgi:hypothetical protein